MVTIGLDKGKKIKGSHSLSVLYGGNVVIYTLYTHLSFKISKDIPLLRSIIFKCDEQN
jgi:hypothetical protein